MFRCDNLRQRFRSYFYRFFRQGRSNTKNITEPIPIERKRGASSHALPSIWPSHWLFRGSASPKGSNEDLPDDAGETGNKTKELDQKSQVWSPLTFSLQQEIGRGAYGKVFVTIHRESGETAAIKIIGKRGPKHVKRSQITQELDIWQLLDPHPFIIGFLAFFETDACYYFVMEYAEKGTLRQHLKNYGAFCGPRTQRVTAQIATAVDYIHSKRIMHRDLSSGNILFDRNEIAKISDFGLSTICSTDNRVYGTLPYVAPEVLRKEWYDNSCDWWSVGILLYEMLVGVTPLVRHYLLLDLDPRKQPRCNLIKAVISGIVTYPPFLTIAAREVIQGLLSTNSRARFNKASLQKLPFFRTIDWNAMVPTK